MRKLTRWNTNKTGGWEKYKEGTTDNALLEKPVESKGENPDKIMKDIDSALEKVKFKSFGKVKEKKKPIVSQIMKNLQEEKKKVKDDATKVEEVDKLIAAQLLDERKESFEKEMKLIIQTFLLR